MHKFYRRVLAAVAALLAAAPAYAAPEEVIVYATVEGNYSAYGGQLMGIIQKGIDDLERFNVNSVAIKPDSLKDINELLNDTRKRGLRWVADFSIVFDKKNRATAILDVYDARKSVRTVRINKDYKVKNIKALLSQMEYEIPKALKNHFLELGRIIKKERRLVYFDLGETAEVKVGDVFRVYREGAEITDESGNSFGRLEKTAGVVRVTNVTSVYSSAAIVVGALSIEPGDSVKKMKDNEISYDASILSVLENQVAISIGKNYGVEEGAHYAVYKDIKPINDKESFKHPIGFIKINEVYDNFATGELEISSSFDLAKFTIKAGDKVQEAESPKKDTLALSQHITNISEDEGKKLLLLTFQKSSMSNVNIAYRMRGGYKASDIFFSTGAMHSLGHSPYFFAGVDFIALSGLPINLFFSADINTPFSKSVKLNLESGYTLGATDELYNGINTSVGVKFSFNIF